jgi:hypothetical protein
MIVLSMMTPELEATLAQAQDVFVWETRAHDHHERGPRWYVALTVVTMLFVVYAIWTANFLFAFLILLAAIILVLAGNEAPRTVLMQVGNNGIVWDGEYISFEQIRHFAIIYQPPEIKVLYIQPKNYFHPRLRVHLEDQDPIALRNHFKRFVTEDLGLRDEHTSDMLARLFRL